jgi:hypothetical protein
MHVFGVDRARKRQERVDKCAYAYFYSAMFGCWMRVTDAQGIGWRDWVTMMRAAGMKLRLRKGSK